MKVLYIIYTIRDKKYKNYLIILGYLFYVSKAFLKGIEYTFSKESMSYKKQLLFYFNGLLKKTKHLWST